MNDVKSVYIHIPFCKNICSYCDFCKMFYQKELVDKYLIALEKEIDTYYQNNIINTLYIGGGTPSSLNIIQLTKLFSIIKKIKLNDNYEFTIELNINDINEELLVLLKNNKINRISIGIQTVNNKFLKLIDRFHTKEDVISKINLVKKYFNNINIDFMYGFYNETLDDLKEDLDFFVSLNVSHISTYSLIIEEHTKLYINNIEQIDEDLEAKMYYYIIDYLNKFGYKHYELSNFAQIGYESKHNLTYWNNNKYYGFGLGASGYINNIRYTNTRSINNYMNGKYRLEEEIITKEIDMENEMILGLRKINGVSLDAFYDKYQKSVEDIFDIKSLINNNYLVIKDNKISINKNYLFVSNNILVNFIKK